MFTVRQRESRETEEAFGAVLPSSTSKQKHLFFLFSLPTGPPGNLILTNPLIYLLMWRCAATSEGMHTKPCLQVDRVCLLRWFMYASLYLVSLISQVTLHVPRGFLLSGHFTYWTESIKTGTLDSVLPVFIVNSFLCFTASESSYKWV